MLKTNLNHLKALLSLILLEIRLISEVLKIAVCSKFIMQLSSVFRRQRENFLVLTVTVTVKCSQVLFLAYRPSIHFKSTLPNQAIIAIVSMTNMLQVSIRQTTAKWKLLPLKRLISCMEKFD